MTPSPIWAQPAEYLMKAGFLGKFAQFTDWPEACGMERTDVSFVLSVIGESLFLDSLDKVYAQGTIKDKPVIIRYINTIEQIKGSHLLFISETKKHHLDDILRAVKTKPILVVGDTKGFGAKGCHINLYVTKKNTLHFEINVNAVKPSGLSIQLVLLEIAKIVGN